MDNDVINDQDFHHIDADTDIPQEGGFELMKTALSSIIEMKGEDIARLTEKNRDLEKTNFYLLCAVVGLCGLVVTLLYICKCESIEDFVEGKSWLVRRWNLNIEISYKE